MGRRKKDIEKIFLLIQYLTSADGWVSVEELQSRLGFTKRELKKLSSKISLCGFPDYTPYDLFDCEYVSGKIKLTVNRDFQQPVQLTEKEARALLMSAELFRKTPIGKTEAFSSAIEKISSCLPSIVIRAIKKMKKGFYIDNGLILTHKEEGIIRKGIKNKEVLLIKYFSRTRKRTQEYEIEPLRLSFYKKEWYLWAWDRKEDKLKSFVVQNILNVKSVNGNFSITEEKEKSLEKTMENYPKRFSDFPVAVLEYRGRAARIMDEILSEESKVKIDKEKLRVKIPFSSKKWIYFYRILPHAGNVKVLKPKELCQYVKEYSKELKERHLKEVEH